MSTVFQNRLAEAVRAGRRAADEAIAQTSVSTPISEIEPEDVGYTDTEILLKITGQKSLHDPEEQEDIIDTFKDAFYNTLEEEYAS